MRHHSHRNLAIKTHDNWWLSAFWCNHIWWWSDTIEFPPLLLIALRSSTSCCSSLQFAFAVNSWIKKLYVIEHNTLWTNDSAKTTTALDSWSSFVSKKKMWMLFHVHTHSLSYRMKFNLMSMKLIWRVSVYARTSARVGGDRMFEFEYQIVSEPAM